MSGWGNRDLSGLRFSLGKSDGYQFSATYNNRIQDQQLPFGGIYSPSLSYVHVSPKMKNGVLEITAIPLVSNLESDTNEIPRWEYIPNLMDIHNIYKEDVSKKIKVWYAMQPFGLQHQQWFGVKCDTFLITTWSQGQNTYLQKTSAYSAGYGSVDLSYRDDGFDLSPSMGSSKSKKIRLKRFFPRNTDWQRHGCLVDVTATIDDQTINRKFMICHDVNALFYAFPISARNTNVAVNESFLSGFVETENVKTAEVPWPTFVSDNIGKAETDYRPDFKFSHDGHRAVCIAKKIDDPWSFGGITSHASTNSGVVPIKESATVLVEIEFDIQITDVGLSDFTFNISVNRSIDPNVTGRSIIAADYAVKDFSEYGISADDLIILEYKMLIKDFCLDNHAHHPLLATKAQVKSLGVASLDGDVVYEWLAHFSFNRKIVLQPSNNNQPYAYATDFIGNTKKPFYAFDEVLDLKFNTWFEKQPTVEAALVLYEAFRYDMSYRCCISSMDLSTLSFVFSIINTCGGSHLPLEDPSAYPYTDYGSVLGNYLVKQRYESISGLLLVGIFFGKEESREWSGYANLRTQTENLFDLNTTNLDFDTFTSFDLRGTIDSVDSNTYVQGQLSGLQGLHQVSSTFYLYLANKACYHYYPNEWNNYTSNSLFGKAYVQNVTFNYGNTSETFINLNGCANVLYDSYYNYYEIFAGISDVYNNVDGSTDVLIGSSIFTFFDTTLLCARPGTVKRRWSEAFDETTQLHDYEITLVGDTGTTGFVGYPFGKTYFNRVLSVTTDSLNNINNRMCTHPNGSFAVFTIPAICFNGKQTLERTHAGYYQAFAGRMPKLIYSNKLTATSTSQAILDKIRIGLLVKNKETQVFEFVYEDISHIAMLNAAFDKNYIKEDYFFNLSYNDEEWGTGDSSAGVRPYTGGVVITNKWSCPVFKNEVNVFYQGQQNFQTGITSSTVIGDCLQQEGVMNHIVMGNDYLNYCSFNRDHKLINNQTRLDLRLIAREGANLRDYSCTAKMEGVFFFSNSYIDREENRI